MILNPQIKSGGGGLSATIRALSNMPVKCVFDATLLPPEYQEVESITGDGNAYIDTGVILDGTPYHIKTTFSYSSAFAQYSSVGGCRNSNNTAYFNLYRNGTNFELDTKNSLSSANAITLGAFDSNIHSADITIGGAVLFDNVSKGNCAIPNTGTPLMLFGFNEGTSPAATSKSSHTLYNYIIEGVRSYVPCRIKATNEYGMFDLVSMTFFGNKGSGAFTGGPEVYHADREIAGSAEGNVYTFANLSNGVYAVSNALINEFVTVDKTTLYSVDLTKFYLYRNGDECTGITGGWGTTGFTATGASIVSGTKQPTQLYLSGASSKYTMLGAINGIDLSAFSKVRAVGQSDSIYSSSLGVSLLVLKTKNITGDKWGFAEATAVGAIDFEVDIADATNGYIAIKADGATTIKGSFTEIWLE